MAKVSVIVRDRKRRRLVENQAEKRKLLKAKGDYVALDKLSRNGSAVRLRNRCAITGRGRGYLRRFGLSRLMFREMASQGRIPGVKKASWVRIERIEMFVNFVVL